MTWAEQLAQKVEECRAAMKDAEARRIAAAADEERAQKALKGYEAALEYERQKDAPQGALAQTSSDSELGGIFDDFLEDVEPEVDATAGKAAFIREFIGKHNGTGVTPAEIYSAVEAAGIKLHRNYVYSVLQRGKSNGTIQSRQGRYFLAPENSSV